MMLFVAIVTILTDIFCNDGSFNHQDPHYCGDPQEKDFLQKEGWVRWKTFEETFIVESFYNFCLPQCFLS